MTGLRTLPIRVAPLPREAFDSWSEALAARLCTPLGQVLRTLGLDAVPHNRGDGPCDIPADWTILLRPREIEHVAYVAGLSPQQVHRMTLAVYQGSAVQIDASKREVNRRILWGRGRGSRFCPDCLAANGGRWLLAWRLSWSFACPIHHRLLADLCPRCGKIPRLRAHSRHVVPRPGLCPTPTPRQGFRSMSQRCDQPLCEVDTMRLGADHPAVRAQGLLLAMFEAGLAQFGVYAAHPLSAIDALEDVKILAARVIADPDPYQLRPLVPPDLLEAHLARPVPLHSVAQQRPGFMALPFAASTALSAVVALKILTHDDFRAAGLTLRTLIASRDGATQTANTVTLKSARRMSPVLRAVRLAALGPSLHPSTQLRHRTVTPSPAQPVAHDAAALAPSRARHIPGMLWNSWAVRLRPPSGAYQKVLRPVLSSALLTVGTPISLGMAANLLGRVTDSLTISRVLQLLRGDPHWEQIHTALDRLATHLDTYDVPIDYQRRRELDYCELLADEQWLELCADALLLPGRGRRRQVAHTLLFHRISGQPLEAAPRYVHQNRAFAAEVAELATLCTPEFTHALDAVARAFLADQGITDEPIVWQPPLSLIEDLELPGADPAAIDATRLHRLIRDDQYSPRRAAAELGFPLDAIRHVLHENPAPAGILSAAQARAVGRVRQLVRKALPPEDFRQLYEDQRLPLRRIAELKGVSRETLARLANDYGIPLRHGAARRQKAHALVDRDWLHKEYIGNGRSLRSLAREQRVSATTMTRQARQLGIPIRSRGGVH